MKNGLLLIVLMALLSLLPGAAPVQAAAPAGASAPGEERPSPTATIDRATGQEDDEEPYTLSAAYPNPFRMHTRFDLRVRKQQKVSVEVYNLLGQRVQTIFKGTLQAEDTRTFTFEANGLPSGLYLYRIKGETFTAARRVTLVR